MELIDTSEADFGCEERPEGMPLMCRLSLKTEDGMIYHEIPDAFADELGLVKGLIISENELEDILSGKIPKDWDSLENRHDYVTKNGVFCMAGAEYRKYMQQKQ